MIKELKNTTQIIGDLNRERTVGTFNEKEFRKTNQNKFRVEKLIKKKDDKFNVKWLRYDNSVNKRINNKKGIVI